MLGVGRDATQTDDTFREQMGKALAESDEVEKFDEPLWQELCKRLHFVSADLTNAVGLRGDRQAARPSSRRDARREERNRLFYLAVPPSVFEPIVRNLSKSGLAPRTRTPDDRPWTRIVVEKPFGRSLETRADAQQSRARALRRASDLSHRSLSRQGDGAERVGAALRQLDLRADLEPAVDPPRADHRGGDGRRRGARASTTRKRASCATCSRTICCSCSSLTAMEPPAQMAANAVRDEKVKVLQSMRWLRPGDDSRQRGARAVHRGDDGREARCRATGRSRTSRPTRIVPTYAAVRLYVDNWRWNGVPFYLRSGKRMAKRVSEIAVQFRSPPHLMFGHATRSGCGRTRSSCACSRTKASRSTSR